jgi:hypothetical protein
MAKTLYVCGSPIFSKRIKLFFKFSLDIKANALNKLAYNTSVPVAFIVHISD